MPNGPLVLNTDRQWFDHLSRFGAGSRPVTVDEVNFWAPKALDCFGSPASGDPVFLRLKAPDKAIAGCAYFAFHYVAPDVYAAWDLFGERNGAATLSELARLLRRDESGLRRPLGCTLLRDAVFWPNHRWLDWGSARGFGDEIVRGRGERTPENARTLLDALANAGATRPADLAERFEPLEFDDRRRRVSEVGVRQGQGTFRARLLGAYGGRCAITGERTEPVLEAAHIQDYGGPASNHVQNGLLLTADFHKLFDAHLVAIEPPTALSPDRYRVRVSNEIPDRWKNGVRYTSRHGTDLLVVPSATHLRPSRVALEWHLARFEST